MKKILSLTLVLVLAVSLAACTPSQKPNNGNAVKLNEDIRIVAICKTLTDNFFLNYQYPCEEAAKELGIKFEWMGPNGNLVEEQVRMFESIVATKPDAILFSPIDQEGSIDLINAAVEQGIAVATFDSDTPDSERAFFIGCDGYSLGKQCGEEMVRALPEGGTIAVLLGQAGIPVLEDRKRGFEDAIKGHNITVRDTLMCSLASNPTTTSVEAIEQYISAYGDEIDGLYCVAGWMCYADTGSMPYTKAWADKGGILINIDTSWESINFIKDGICKVHIAQDTRGAAMNAIKILVRMVKGEALPAIVADMGLSLDEKNNIWLGGVYVDADNCDEVRKILPEGF